MIIFIFLRRFVFFLTNYNHLFKNVKLDILMMQFKIKEQFFSWQRALVMGILNVTPDSFFDGGLHNNIYEALSHCNKMLKEGADIIDIGAFSTRPDSTIISMEEENKRLLPVLEAVRKDFPEIIISIDTFHKNTAEKAIDKGADIINDISGGLFDEEMLPYIGKNHIPYILMHITGTLENMHKNPINDKSCEIVRKFFEEQVTKLTEYGKQQIILDPGIGFNKTVKANYELLGGIEKYRINKMPVLIGISHKSLISKVLGITSQESLNGTTVLNTIALMKGADILRVHDVKEAVEAVRLVRQIG